MFDSRIHLPTSYLNQSTKIRSLSSVEELESSKEARLYQFLDSTELMSKRKYFLKKKTFQRFDVWNNSLTSILAK